MDYRFKIVRFWGTVLTTRLPAYPPVLVSDDDPLQSPASFMTANLVSSLPVRRRHCTHYYTCTHTLHSHPHILCAFCFHDYANVISALENCCLMLILFLKNVYSMLLFSLSFMVNL